MSRGKKKKRGEAARTKTAAPGEIRSSGKPAAEKSTDTRRVPDRPAASGRPDIPARTVRRALVVILTAASLMRLQLMLRAGLWLDEVYVLQNVNEPFSENLKTLHWVHFLALKPFVALGDSDFLLRLPAFLFGMALIPLGYATASRLFDRSTGLAWAACLAFAPWFVNFSVECKYYSHMMFWGMFGLYFASRLITTRRLRNLVPVLLAAPAGFYVHPFFGLYYSIFLGLLALHVVLTDAYFVSLPGYSRFLSPLWKRCAVLAVIVAAASCVIFFAAGDRGAGRALALAGSFISRISPGAHPENIESSFHFFHAWFNETGTAFYQFPHLSSVTRIFAAIGNLILIPLFLGGIILTFRKCRPLALLIIVEFVVCFVLLFNFDAGRFFSSRYYSNLVPLYWLAIAIGATGLVRFIVTARPGIGHRGIAAAACLPAFLLLPQYIFLLVHSHGNWDRVMPAFIRDAKPGEAVLYSNWAEQTLIPFYMNRYGATEHPLIKLDHTDRRGPVTAAQLREHCIANESLWFFSSWLDIKSDEAVRWAERHMTKVAEGASIFAPSNRVTIYHWTGGRSFVPRDRLLTRDIAGSEGLWNETFRFESAGRYRITADPAAGIAITLNGAPLPRSSDTPTIEEGVHTIEVTFAGDSRARTRMTIAPAPDPEGLTIAAADAFEIYPTIWTWTPPEENSQVLCLKRNSFAGYRFGIAVDGDYRMMINAKNDIPGPVLLDLEMDGRALGVLSFAGNNNEWSMQTAGVPLEQGNHHLRINFLNEGDVWASEEDKDTDAWIRSIRIVSDAGVPADDDLLIRTVASRSVPLAAPDGTSPAPDWMQASGAPGSIRIVRDDELESVALAAEIAPDSAGLHYVSPPQKPSESGIIHYSALLRAENLMNHSVNLRTHFFDRQGRELGSSIVNQEGIYYTTGRVRFVELERAGPQVESYRIVLWCYPNSTRKSDEPGRIYMAEVEVHEAERGDDGRKGESME